MPSSARTIVVLGTGGTIAGVTDGDAGSSHYVAGALAVEALVAALPAVAGLAIESEEVARIDSKDIDFATWQRLAARVAHHLARPGVRGVVVTHGTDTLEETAYFLQRVLAPGKPVIVTGAMRPATSAEADGPGNLADAISVAASTDQAGVAVAFAGHVHSARDVRKVHPHRLDAFTSGDAGPLGRVEGGRYRATRPWPADAAALAAGLPSNGAAWPRVAIVTSAAGAQAESVGALVAAGFNGIVVATTGNGTVHAALEPALREARAQGVGVLLATRCIAGSIVDAETGGQALPVAADLTPAKARVELIVRLLAGPEPRSAA